MKLCGFDVGLDHPLFVIAGPCVVESREMAMDTAGKLKEMTAALGIPFIYKSSYDKANRSSGKSFRGLGVGKGLEILADVRKQIGVPVLTDVHAEDEVAAGGGAGERRSARIRAGAGACRGGDRRRRGVHGNPPESGEGAFRRPQCLAPAPDEVAARNAQVAR